MSRALLEYLASFRRAILTSSLVPFPHISHLPLPSLGSYPISSGLLSPFGRISNSRFTDDYSICPSPRFVIVIGYFVTICPTSPFDYLFVSFMTTSIITITALNLRIITQNRLSPVVAHQSRDQQSSCSRNAFGKDLENIVTTGLRSSQAIAHSIPCASAQNSAT